MDAMTIPTSDDLRAEARAESDDVRSGLLRMARALDAAQEGRLHMLVMGVLAGLDDVRTELTIKSR